MIALFAGVSYAEADEKRRALGDVEGMAETRTWFFPRALGRGYPLEVVEQVWKVLEAFASFGFCKAHAAAFALPTYQSAWLKAHWPAHFLAGVLTHDPGMYPKRLILDDARQCGIAVLGLDVNASAKELRRRADGRPSTSPLPWCSATPPASAGRRLARRPGLRHPAGAGRGQGDQRGRGGPDRRGPALPLAHRLLAPRPRLPADRGAAGAGRRLRQPLPDRLGRPRRPPPRPGHPPRPAAPGRRARPARPGRWTGPPGAGGSAAGRRTPAAAAARADAGRRAQQHRPAHPGAAAGPGAPPAGRRGRVGAGGRPVPGDPRRRGR